MSCAASRKVPVERAVFLEVLHRLFRPGSDRAGASWRNDYAIEGTGGLALHHAYRAMAWLGDELSGDQQFGKTPFSPRTTKDTIAEFDRRKWLYVLGARMRTNHEVRDGVLGRGGRVVPRPRCAFVTH